MNEEHINKVKQILTDWNPLGEKASQIEDLENYETEAIDILFYIDKKTSTDRINRIMTQVLSEAFGVYVELGESKKYAKKIRTIINDQ
jgi:5S rRNA maturation endonuclease (ribonuclease M5)